MKLVQQKWFVIVTMISLLCLTGLVLSGTAFSAGSPQCEENGDGTVTDNGTGLMWQKAKSDDMKWQDANSYASALSLGGHSGWQLPSYYDLRKLYKSECKNLMDLDYEEYWASSEAGSVNAAIVNLYNGHASYTCKLNSFYVRAVRSVQ